MAHSFITNNFKVSSAEQFKESLTEPANTILYLYYGKHTPFPEGDVTPAFEESVSKVHYESYRNMIGGKKVNDADVMHMVKRKDWSSGTAYSMYDDTTAHLDETDFFVIRQETSNYNVFKCIKCNLIK